MKSKQMSVCMDVKISIKQTTMFYLAVRKSLKSRRLVLPLEKSDVMGEVDVPNSEVSAGLDFEVKLESDLTLGVVVETVGWGVVSGDGVDMVVMGLVVSEDWGV